MASSSKVVLLFGLLAQAVLGSNDATATVANPVRKVVQMLQAMQEKVQAEGEKEQKLYEAFECYCKTNGGDLQESIAAAELKVPSVGSDIEEAEAKKVQLEQDLKNHKYDRSEAKKAIAEADALREKEAAAFAKEKSEADSNIGALTAAITALERGISGGFLQTTTAQVLKKLTLSSKRMMDPDRREVLAFLSNGDAQGYVPQSGEIVGILKELKDEMSKDLGDATSEEEEAISSHAALVEAKTKEVSALTTAIEDKSTRLGEVSVKIVAMKEDLSDTEAALLDDKKFLADLEGSCESKSKEWDERSKTRAEELKAIAETIKILNDDDALELFKKTMPSPSLVQMEASTQSEGMRKQALVVLRELQSSVRPAQASLDFISLALSGKKVGLEKVMKMIDELVETLKKEQTDDDHKKETCGTQLDLADDKKKVLENKKSGLEVSMADTEEAVSTLKSELKALEASIKKLDKEVATATEQRKDEHASYTELMTSNKAAKDLLMLAKNRLHKFYTPQLYNVTTLVQEKPVMLVEVGEHLQRVDDAPAPPPETWSGYETKGAESNGVLSMMDLLVKALEKEMTEAETEEKDAQADYEKAMDDGAAARLADSKHLNDKKAALADTETVLETHKEDHTSTANELGATEEYLAALHGDCDWLIKYYEVRKEARAGEIDALGRAKAVLSGASFS
mmetsp:Transcript_40959/g.94277  ORF Transcript_40959/g.94277 Transcript_40959/m.94277 type:complete len:685 (+) Transcript_40959:95-2149(+)